MPDELSTTNWPDHAILGLSAVKAIHEVHEALKESIRFGDEMRGKLWNEISTRPTWKEPVRLDDGGDLIAADSAIENRVKVATSLFDTIKELGTALDMKLGQKNG